MINSTVDTPRKNAWYQQVNQASFVPRQPARQRVVIRTINTTEARELSRVFSGRG